MHMFRLKSFKPMAVAKISNMRLIRVRRSDATPVSSTINHLQQVGALAAVVAKNVTSIMGPPAISSSSSSYAADKEEGGKPGGSVASLLDAHTQYSFIAVVALMSIFLVITVSATGVLLAFCRKKNAVFNAPEKPDADSHLELDDIDNSDVEVLRGDKGECYYHFSDEENDDTDECGDEEEPEEDENENVKIDKRSRTFPQLKRMLLRRRGQPMSCGKEGQSSKACTPLMGKEIPSRDHDQISENAGKANDLADLQGIHRTDHSPARPHQKTGEIVTTSFREAKVAACRNPNHQHYSRQHLYNRSKNHQKNQRLAIRPSLLHPTKGSRLHRSHTIHYIPQSEPRPLRPSGEHGAAMRGVRIKVNDTETVESNCTDDVEVCTVQLHHIPTVSSSVRYSAIGVDNMEDIFNEEATFEGLRLRIEQDDSTFAGDDNATYDYIQQYGPQPSSTAGSNPHSIVVDGNGDFSSSMLLSDFLTCPSGASSSSSDCIFNRDNRAEAENARRAVATFSSHQTSSEPRPSSLCTSTESFTHFLHSNQSSKPTSESENHQLNYSLAQPALTFPGDDHFSQNSAETLNCVVLQPARVPRQSQGRELGATALNRERTWAPSEKISPEAAYSRVGAEPVRLCRGRYQDSVTELKTNSSPPDHRAGKVNWDCRSGANYPEVRGPEASVIIAQYGDDDEIDEQEEYSDLIQPLSSNDTEEEEDLTTSLLGYS